MSTALYKDGDQMAIRTSAPSEGAFTEEFASALAELIDAGTHEHDWQFQLERWLAAFVEIVNAYRGYKTEAHRASEFAAGDLTTGRGKVVEIGKVVVVPPPADASSR